MEENIRLETRSIRWLISLSILGKSQAMGNLQGANACSVTPSEDSSGLEMSKVSGVLRKHQRCLQVLGATMYPKAPKSSWPKWAPKILASKLSGKKSAKSSSSTNCALMRFPLSMPLNFGKKTLSCRKECKKWEMWPKQCLIKSKWPNKQTKNLLSNRKNSQKSCKKRRKNTSATRLGLRKSLKDCHSRAIVS